jgi:hypothetical protein
MKYSVREQLRSDPWMTRLANNVIVEAANIHGVLVADVVRFSECKDRRLTAARADVIRDLCERIVWRGRSEREWRLRLPGEAVPMDGWAPISLPDVAAMLGAHHTSILLALRRARVASAEAVEAA